MLKIQNVYLSLLYTCKKPNSLKESVKVTPDSICQSLENWYVSCLWLQIFRTAAPLVQELSGENVPVGGGKESQERNNAILPQNEIHYVSEMIIRSNFFNTYTSIYLYIIWKSYWKNGVRPKLNLNYTVASWGSWPYFQ